MAFYSPPMHDVSRLKISTGSLPDERRPSYHSRNPSSSSLMGTGGAGSGGSGASASAIPMADPISRSVSMTSVNSCDLPEHRHSHHYHQCHGGGGLPGTASNRSPQKQLTQQSAAQLTGPAFGAAVVEREDLLALTHDVRNFKEALAKLRNVFFAEREQLNNTELLVSAHEKLGDVLRILRGILQKYPPIQSSELLLSASALIQNVKNYNYEESDPSVENNSQIIYDAIDQLALAFSS
ncbi:minor histocompatibility protein HA-1-like, partial [Tropilaelaps mercedesae]